MVGETVNVADVQNALMKQKNALLAGLSLCDDHDDFRRLFEQLFLLAPLWKALGYGYKLHELCALLVERAESKVVSNEEARDLSRKGTRSWRLFESEVRKLRRLIGDAHSLAR